MLAVRSRWWRVGNTFYLTLGQALRVEWGDPLMRPWWWAADRWGGYRVELLGRDGEWVDFGRFFTLQRASKLQRQFERHHDTARVVAVSGEDG